METTTTSPSLLIKLGYISLLPIDILRVKLVSVFLKSGIIKVV